MKYIVDLPEEIVEKANPFEGEIGSALHDAIYLDSFIEGIKGEIETDLSYICFDDWGNEKAEWTQIKAVIDKNMGKEKE